MPARMSTFPTRACAERPECDGDDRERAQRVAEDREDPRGPEVEHVLGVRDLRPREVGVQRDREGDPDREPRVHERQRSSPATAHEEERAGSEQRGGEKRAAEVVDAKRGIAPAGRRCPTRARRPRPRTRRAPPPRRRARAPSGPPAADEIAREPERDQRRAERQERIHDEDCIALPRLYHLARAPPPRRAAGDARRRVGGRPRAGRCGTQGRLRRGRVDDPAAGGEREPHVRSQHPRPGTALRRPDAAVRERERARHPPDLQARTARRGGSRRKTGAAAARSDDRSRRVRRRARDRQDGGRRRVRRRLGDRCRPRPAAAADSRPGTDRGARRPWPRPARARPLREELRPERRGRGLPRQPARRGPLAARRRPEDPRPRQRVRGRDQRLLPGEGDPGEPASRRTTSSRRPRSSPPASERTAGRRSETRCSSTRSRSASETPTRGACSRISARRTTPSRR